MFDMLRIFTSKPIAQQVDCSTCARSMPSPVYRGEPCQACTIPAASRPSPGTTVESMTSVEASVSGGNISLSAPFCIYWVPSPDARENAIDEICARVWGENVQDWQRAAVAQQYDCQPDANIIVKTFAALRMMGMSDEEIRADLGV